MLLILLFYFYTHSLLLSNCRLRIRLLAVMQCHGKCDPQRIKAINDLYLHTNILRGNNNNITTHLHIWFATNYVKSLTAKAWYIHVDHISLCRNWFTQLSVRKKLFTLSIINKLNKSIHKHFIPLNQPLYQFSRRVNLTWHSYGKLFIMTKSAMC